MVGREGEFWQAPVYPDPPRAFITLTRCVTYHRSTCRAPVSEVCQHCLRQGAFHETASLSLFQKRNLHPFLQEESVLKQRREGLQTLEEYIIKHRPLEKVFQLCLDKFGDQTFVFA